MPNGFRAACKPDRGEGGRGTCKNDNEKPRKNLTVLFCFPITGHVKNKMSMLFVSPRLTKELRACYKVYVGKEITLTFYFYAWPVMGQQNNIVKFGVPGFFSLLRRRS